jgi:hypothetical protein
MSSNAQIDLRRLLWVGPLAVLASVISVLIVRMIAVALLNPGPAFTPLGWGPPIFFTTLLVTGAVVVFALIGRLARSPIRTFQIIAVVVLVLSFIPDLLLLVAPMPPPDGPPPIGDVTLPNVLALMVMHVVAWATSVGIITRLTRER